MSKIPFVIPIEVLENILRLATVHIEDHDELGDMSKSVIGFFGNDLINDIINEDEE